MTNSAQHELAKFLAAFLQPVLNFYSSYCILDSFTFAEEIQKLPISTENSYLCSFDISSLFTNVPLTETIQICANKLYENEKNSPPFSKDIFIELMNMATSSVEFSFNNIMYKQIDGISMGSPLGPALANIFVGFYEQQLFQTTNKPTVYYRYVDDTFAIFKLESDCDKFLSSLNSLHPALHFTFEKEANQSLPFLDVFIEKSGNNFLTSIYRKPTFTGQYLRWDSFGPTKRKTNLIGTLVHRALKICSKSKLQQELDQIRAILLNNGYPEYIINTSISKKISKFNSAKKEGPQKCPVYLRLPWIGKVSQKFEKLSKSAVNQCYGAVDPRVIFSTKKILPAVHKDVLPTTQQSMIVYQYVCATVIVGTWAVQPKDCRIESISISPKVLEPDTNNRNSNHNEIAKRLQQKLTAIRPLDNIFCKAKPVPTTSTPTSFLFWLKQERNFTYLHWKQHSFGF